MSNPAGAQLPGAPPVSANAPAPPLRHGYLAVTRCEHGVPVTTVNPHLDSLTRIETEAHEAAHRRQLAGDCDARLRALQADLALRLDREAEAYCGGLAALGLDSLRYGVAVERLRLALYDVFWPRPQSEVDARITAYCRRPDDGVARKSVADTPATSSTGPRDP
ncbi:MAG TPA: hypothetical protein VFW66_01620 [Gemmatimonadales bacterium]|nr:hypothetical protein [Gemmatimonadales bacterium]